MALWLLLGLTAGLCLAGLLLLVRGLRPPRRGDDPHCRRCDYNLTGVASPICPECGTPLAGEAIVRGERRRRLGVVLVGCLLALAGLLWNAWLVGGVVSARANPTRGLLAARVVRAKAAIADVIATVQAEQFGKSDTRPRGPERRPVLPMMIKDWLPSGIATRVKDPKVRAAALAELAAADALLETQIMAAFSTAVASKKPADIEALVALLKQLDRHMDRVLQILKGY